MTRTQQNIAFVHYPFVLLLRHNIRIASWHVNILTLTSTVISYTAAPQNAESQKVCLVLYRNLKRRDVLVRVLSIRSPADERYLQDLT